MARRGATASEHLISTNACARKRSVSPTSGAHRHESIVRRACDRVRQTSPEVVVDNGLNQLVPSRIVLGTVFGNQVVAHE